MLCSYRYIFQLYSARLLHRQGLALGRWPIFSHRASHAAWLVLHPAGQAQPLAQATKLSKFVSRWPGQPKNRQPIRPLLNIDWKMAFKSLGISILNTRACVGSMMSNVTRKDRETGTSSEDRVRPFFDSLLRGLWSDFLFQVARAVGSHHFICGLP